MKTTRLVLLSVVTCAATAFAVDPPPDGGYRNQNTAEGEDALLSLDTSQEFDNTAVGFEALRATTDGGNENTATGAFALWSNRSGYLNTASGVFALQLNTTGYENTASGAGALSSNTVGFFNTASGVFALSWNTTGHGNTASGYNALTQNTTGSENTGFGDAALQTNSRGNFNTAIGTLALQGASGDRNIALGYQAGGNLTTGDANIHIGNRGMAGDSKIIRIGEERQQTATFIAGIIGATVPNGVAVVIDSSGHLGTITSSARYKEAIKPMDKASEAILALEPVRFRYKKELDPKAIPQFGLVAEQVAKVDPDLVARDHQGEPYTVRYEAVNAMLLNEFLKEHRKVEKLEAAVAAQQKGFESEREQSRATAAQQQNEIQTLIAALEAQAAQIQKVSDQLNADVPAPRVVAND